MSTFSSPGINHAGSFLTQPYKTTVETQKNSPTLSPVKASTELPSIADTVSVKRRVQQEQRTRKFLFGSLKTAVKTVDAAITVISPNSWVRAKKFTRRMFDNPTVAAYSNSPKVRNRRTYGGYTTSGNQYGTMAPDSKLQQNFLPLTHINYTAPVFPTIRPHTGADLQKLHEIERSHGAALSEMQLVPNGFILSTGEKMVCRHLVEQWIDDENLLANGPQTYAQIDGQKLTTLQNLYKRELIDAGRTKQFVHHTKVGRWLEDITNSLPANCSDIPIRISNESHRMGLKISTGKFSDGRRSLTIKVYDPDAAKMVSCGPMPVDAVGNLQLADLFPLYSQERNAGGFIFSHASEHKSAPFLRYLSFATDLESKGNAFVLSCHAAGSELFSQLASNILEGPADQANDLLAYMARHGEENPLIFLTDLDYNPIVFRRTIDLMKHAGLRGKSAEDYLARIVSIENNTPLLGFMFEKKHAGGVRNFFAALSALNIDKPGMCRLLTQPSVLGHTPIHFLSENLDKEKVEIFFTWAALNKLSPREISSMFLAQDNQGTTAIQAAVWAQRSSPENVVGLLAAMKAYGFSPGDVHALLSIPNKHGLSTINQLENGQNAHISDVISNWIKKMGQ